MQNITHVSPQKKKEVLTERGEKNLRHLSQLCNDIKYFMFIFDGVVSDEQTHQIVGSQIK